jgi:nucleoid DNA-binding protein
MSKSLVMQVLKKHLPTRRPADLSKLADSIFDAFTVELAVTGKLALPGTGSLRVKIRPARRGRNPATGEVIEIPEKAVVRFSAAERLYRALETDDEGEVN